MGEKRMAQQVVMPDDCLFPLSFSSIYLSLSLSFSHFSLFHPPFFSFPAELLLCARPSCRVSSEKKCA